MQSKSEHLSTRRGTTGGAGPLAGGPAHGRGAGFNTPNRFETIALDQLPAGGGADDLIHEVVEEVGDRRVVTKVMRDRSRTVINKVESPDLNFAWTLNPYRGCEHGCIYCYARPTHETFGLSAGLDFETQIFTKLEAPELLLHELSRRTWRGEPIMMSGITDVYQPVERQLKLTRGCLEVMQKYGQPVMIITKSALVLRDLDLLAEMASRQLAKVAISLTTLDPALSATMEPRASSPAQRLRAVRELTHAGVPVMVMTAPIIPAINDHEVPALLQAAARAGAVGAGYVLLRLPWQNKELFLEWLTRHYPDRAGKVESLIRDGRGGKLYDSAWGSRMRGEGPFAEQIGQTFGVMARRYGLDRPRAGLTSDLFTRPERQSPGQLSLFEAGEAERTLGTPET